MGRLYRWWASRLMVRLVSSFLVLTLITVILAASLGYSQARNELTRSAFDRLEALANFKAAELARWLEDQHRDLSFLAWTPELRRNLHRLMQQSEVDAKYDVEYDAEYKESYEVLSDYLNTFATNQTGLSEVFILSAVEGTVLVSTNPANVGEHNQDDVDFFDIQRATANQNVYVSSSGGQIRLAISTPIVKEAQYLGFLVAYLNQERLNRIILQEGVVGSTVKIYLVDKNHHLISTDSQKEIERLESFGINEALRGRDGQSSYINYDAVPVIGVYQWLPNIQLALLAEIEQREASVPARQLATNIIAVGLLLVIFLALTVYWMAYRIATPILAITEAAERVTMGDLTRGAPVMTHDEIGELAQVFNAMQQGWRTSRLQLEEYARTLEHRVSARTVELQTANQILSKRAVQLETTSKVGWQITSLLDLEELLATVVQIIQANFDYYFVGIWLLTDDKQGATLKAGTDLLKQDFVANAIEISITDPHSIVAKVCQTRLSYLSNDTLNDPVYMPWFELPHTRSELALSMQTGHHMIGVLDIQSDQLNAFAEEDQTILQILANQVGIAIRNAQLYQSEYERREFAEALQAIGRVLGSSLDLNEVPHRILQQLQSIVPYERGLVLLHRDELLDVIARQGFPDDKRSEQLHIQVRHNQDDIFLRLAETNQPLLIGDVSQEPGWQQLEWLPLNYSWIGVPLIALGKTIGMISLTRPEKNAFDLADSSIVLTFAGQAAIALENARLYHEITGFNEQLEQRVAERTVELERAYTILERLDQTKSDFIKVSSHELRTPLTVISGYAQLLGTSPTIQQDNVVSDLLEGITSGVDRLHRVVNNMLDVAKIATDALEVHLEETNLAQIIDWTRKALMSSITERHLSFTLSGLDALPTIQADPDLLEKVFYNLFTNAIKYTPDGGQVRVHGSQITLDSTKQVEIVVQDNGIGIDPQHHELIFEKFYQTGKLNYHSSGDTKFKGAGPGLGLAIVKGIVEGHGGRIWVESQGYDEAQCPGSRFYIQLPLA